MARGRGRTTEQRQAYRAGFRDMMAACSRDGSVAKEPSIQQREDWAPLLGHYRAGWERAQRATDLEVETYYEDGTVPGIYIMTRNPRGTT